MGSFVSKQTVRITVDDKPDEWIDIKPKLSMGDRAKFQDAVLSAEFSRGGDKAKISMATGQLLSKMLELAITDWKLLDDEGKQVAFKPSLIARLDPDDPLVDRALAEVTERNPTLLGQSEKDGSES